MKLTLSETAAALSGAKKLVITAHVNPDGDAIGSSLGLMHLLRGLGKDVTVLLDDDIPAIFSVLPGYSHKYMVLSVLYEAYSSAPPSVISSLCSSSKE